MELNELLLYLNRFGLPSLNRITAGWYCALEVFVAAKGATFKIQSDYGHQAPILAALECQQRLNAALSQIERNRLPAPIDP